MRPILYFTICALSLTSLTAEARIKERTLEKLVGWTLIDVKTIEGFYNDEGQYEESFEGCNYDRIIKFDDGTIVECSSYGYQYAYRPNAFLFGKSVNHNGKSFTMFKMLVEDDLYDIR
jgi:hypothetical protein